MKRRLKYLLLTLLIFTILVLIVLFFSRNDFIRGFLGDILVVWLIFFFFKIWHDFPTLPLVIGVMVFAYVVEVLQLFHLVEMLGLEQNRLAVIVLGATFDWWDILAYTLGGMGVWLIEFALRTRTEGKDN